MGKKKKAPDYIQYAVPYGMHSMNPPQTPPVYGIPNPDQGKKKKKKIAVIACIIVALLLIGGGTVFALTQCSDMKASLRDPNQSEGQLEGKSAAEIQAELNRQVEYGMFNISIAAGTDFYDGQSEGELKIENVPNNNYLMQVTIYDNNTGQAIYTSGILDPNHHIQRAKLDVDLDAGVYDCTAMFSALDPVTEQPVGQAAAKIVIKVLN